MNVAETLLWIVEQLGTPHQLITQIEGVDEVDLDTTIARVDVALKFSRLPTVVRFKAVLEAWDFDRIKTETWT